MPKAKSKPRALATWVNDVKVFRASFNYQDKDWLETDQLKKDIKAHLAQNPGAD